MAPAKTDPDFLDHLESLRRNLIGGGAFFIAAAIGAFLCADPIVALLKQPADAMNIPLYFLRPQEKFLAYLRVSLSASLLATLPALLLLAVRFVAPALTARERRFMIPAAAAVFVLYLFGLAFALFVVVPVALGFFAGFRATDGIRPLWSIGEYVRIIFSLLYAFCLVFQSPLLLLLLVRGRILRIDTLRRYRRHAVLLILVLSALVTPPDVVSQLLVAVPLYLLYEGTILVARLTLRGRQREEVGSWTDGSF